MKLLFDENLSPQLVEVFSRSYPGSRHVDHVGLRGESDERIWEYAGREGFALVSKDNDFRQLSFLHGAPPKVIWLSVGDLGTNAIADLISESALLLRSFLEDPEESLFILERAPDSRN